MKNDINVKLNLNNIRVSSRELVLCYIIYDCTFLFDYTSSMFFCNKIEFKNHNLQSNVFFYWTYLDEIYYKV